MSNFYFKYVPNIPGDALTLKNEALFIRNSTLTWQPVFLLAKSNQCTRWPHL